MCTSLYLCLHNLLKEDMPADWYSSACPNVEINTDDIVIKCIMTVEPP